MKTSLGVWAFGPMVTRFVPGGYQPQRAGETTVERVLSEIRFYNHPAAVAIPIYSVPGTSGAPIVDSADGRLLGMVVGHLSERRDISAVIPAQFLYEILSKRSSRP